MNLNNLFEIQAKLDERIREEHNLQGVDLLDKKILALKVELGELANNWRGFKFWSKDQEPRNKDVRCHACKGKGGFIYTDEYQQATEPFEECMYCEGTGIQEKNPLLEEYVDCLHFILSIGLECQFEDGEFYTTHRENAVDQFNKLFDKVGDFSQYHTKGNYEWLFCLFLGLSDFLGFTWEQVEQAYLDKNKINHERQEQGY